MGEAFLRAAVAGLAAAFMCGCGSKSSSPAPSPSGQEIVQNDLQGLANIDTRSLSVYDQDHNGLFTAIFGGPSADSLYGYLNVRIHYYLTSEELNSFSQSQLLRPMRSLAPEDGGVQIGAVNIGTGLWLEGLINGTDIVLTRGGERIDVDSSRVGLMEIGPGYNIQAKIDDQTYPMPSAFRQSILIHEARHSDCTGGITPADVNELKISDLDPDDPSMPRACGHLHSICPPGHDYAGYAACDNLPWGAYAVQYVFLSAVRDSYPDDSVEQSILDAAIIDTKSRLQFDVDAMMAGQMGAPDMRSAGLHE